MNDIELANKKFDELYEITRKQDEIQLSIPRINESIAISTSIINDANAIILEISKWKGDLEPICRYGYLFEKVKSLVSGVNSLYHDYGIAFGERVPKIDMSCLVNPEFEDFRNLDEETKKEKMKDIFRNIRLNKQRQLEKIM